MAVATLHEVLPPCGVRLVVDGDHLCAGPADRVTSDVIALITDHKAAAFADYVAMGPG